MKKRLSLLIVALISIVLIAVSWNAISSQQSYRGDLLKVNINDLAPRFDLNDINGNHVALKNLVNEKVYVKYWASWCSICLAGLDELNTLASQENGFKVITIVSPGYKGEMSAEEFKKWFNSLPTEKITVLLDEKGIWAKEFGVVAYPTSYYIGSYGVLEKTVVGHNSNEQITSFMKNIK